MKKHGKILASILIVAAFAFGAGAFSSHGSVESAPAAGSDAATLVCFFSPHGGAKDAIVAEIDGAREEILVAMYNFTSEDLAGALARAKERGVRVRVILDEGQIIHAGSKSQGRQSKYLAESGIAVCFDTGGGLMHDKFAVIDRAVVITGSYNWTGGAEERNRENLVIVHNAGIAAQYADAFAAIQQKCGAVDK